MKRILMALAVVATLISPVLALDKKKLETHLRKAFNLTANIPIQISDPQPSEFAGLNMVKVTVASNEVPIYLAKDDKHYFWGRVFDMTTDPDSERWSKINLKKVHFKGAATAPVTVVEYSDLECSHCMNANKMLNDELYKNYTQDQVRLVFKHFPLAMHKWAETASVASECAGRQSEAAFWKMNDSFFQNQESVTDDNVKQKAKEFAAAAGVDKTKFDVCFDTAATVEQVRADRKEGNDVGVNATPTFVVNGRMVKGDTFADLKSAIDEKLAEKKKQP